MYLPKKPTSEKIVDVDFSLQRSGAQNRSESNPIYQLWRKSSKKPIIESGAKLVRNRISHIFCYFSLRRGEGLLVLAGIVASRSHMVGLASKNRLRMWEMVSCITFHRFWKYFQTPFFASFLIVCRFPCFLEFEQGAEHHLAGVHIYIYIYIYVHEIYVYIYI